VAVSAAGDAWRLWAATLAFFGAFYALFVPIVARLDALAIRGRSASLVLAALAVASLGGRLLAGPLVDRGGARRAAMVGAGLLAIAGVGFATGTTAPALLAARAAQGLAYAVFTTAGYALAGTRAPAGRRAVALARLSTATTLALALTPPAVATAPAALGPAAVAVAAALLAAVAAGLVAGGSDPLTPSVGAAVSARPGGLPWPLPAERLPMLRAALSGLAFGTFAQLAQRGALFVVFGAGTLATRVLLDRVPPAALTRLRVPFALLALGLALLSAPMGPPLAAAAALLVAVGLGVLAPALLAWQLSLRPASARGTATAVYYLGFDLGLGVASIAIGLCPPAAAYALAAVAACAGALVSPPPRAVDDRPEVRPATRG
jgi:predicted MFS family arabinose efflux permease